MRNCCCQDGVLAEHRTAVTASFSGGSKRDAADETVSDSAEQTPVDKAALATGDAAATSAEAESRQSTQQSGGDTTSGWKAADARQPAQSAGASAAAEAQDQEQDIGPFEPEAVVSVLAAEDSNPPAQVPLMHQDSSTRCIFTHSVHHCAVLCLRIDAVAGQYADDDRQWRRHGYGGGWAQAPDAPCGAAVSDARPHAARAIVARLLPSCCQAHTGCGTPSVTALGTAPLDPTPHPVCLACLHMHLLH